MVNLHFLSLLEALLECRAVTLCKLIPMWKEVLFTDKNIKVHLNQNVFKFLLFFVYVRMISKTILQYDLYNITFNISYNACLVYEFNIKLQFVFMITATGAYEITLGHLYRIRAQRASIN